MRLIVLGSGSTGNVLYVESGDTRVLIDAGLSGKETARRMVEVGIDPSRLNGIVVTHEHSDHTLGLRVLSRTLQVPVFTSSVTRIECKFPRGDDGMVWGDAVISGEQFSIGELEFAPFSIPHDSVDPFAMTISAGGVKASIITDLGYITTLVSQRIQDSTLVLIESNHDLDMLKAGPYPWPLKQRIASRLGHTSNAEAARWLREEFDGKAEYVVLAHLSQQCKHPEVARLCAIDAIRSRENSDVGDGERRVRVAAPDKPGEWFEL
jgi:phosphoribosyl 1,2-cyclic phosphodiesterase